MGRKRRRETKVWHDPHMAVADRRRPRDPARMGTTEDRNGRKEGRGRRRGKIVPADPARRAAARIISGPQGEMDPRTVERERLLTRLLNVEGRPAITKAAEAYEDAGFELPLTQGVWLQLLEHLDEGTVCRAIEHLTELLVEEPPTRKAVLESRLRRIEEYADDPSTSEAAAELRRLLSSRPSQSGS